MRGKHASAGRSGRDGERRGESERGDFRGQAALQRRDSAEEGKARADLEKYRVRIADADLGAESVSEGSDGFKRFSFGGWIARCH